MSGRGMVLKVRDVSYLPSLHNIYVKGEPHCGTGDRCMLLDPVLKKP